MPGRSPITVGRDRQLALLEQALADARAGRGRCAVLLGEAGSGKTRLVREAAARAGAAGMTVLSGDAPATVAPSPFGVLAAALRGWLRGRKAPSEQLAPFAAGLRLVLPEWPVPEAAASTPEQARLLALEGALRLITEAGIPRGALLILDDLHRADPETIAFLHHLAGSIAAAPVAVIAASRTGEGAGAEDEVRALEQRGWAELLDVTPLDREATATMIEALLDAAPPDGFADEVMARTDGNPLLIEELVAATVTAGSLRARGGTYTWAREATPIVPRTILEMTRRRLLALAPEVRRAVEALAVTRHADTDVLARMTGDAPGQIGASLARALETGLLEPSREGTTFRHALLMEATADGLLAEQRTALHRAAAEAIASLHADDPSWFEERARHHAALGEHEAAASLLLAAARHDLAGHAPASAEAIARRALTLPSPVVADLRDVLAEALSALGRREDALRIDEEQGGPDTAARLTRMAGNALRTGRLDDADALIARAAGAGAEPGPLRALAALASLWRGDLDAAAARSRDALAMSEPHGDPQVVCDALDVLGRANDMMGNRAEGIDAFRRWIDVATAAGLRASALQAHMELGNVEFMTTYDPSSLRTTRTLALEAGAYQTLVLADLSLIWCLGATGDLPEALSIGDEALDIARRFELDLLPHVMEAVAWARGRRRYGSGDELLDEAVALAGDDVDFVVQAYDARADHLVRAGRFADALEQLDRAVAVMASNPAAVPLVAPSKRVCALLALGRRDEAEAALADARALAERPRLMIVPMWVQAAAAMVEGSETALEEAVPADTTAAYERATLLSLGASLIAGSRAGAWLREALAIYERAQAEDDAAQARRALRRLGEPVPRARRTTAAPAEQLRARGVTRREAEVLALIGAGRSNAEIAAELFLSVRTVESHVSSLLAKLDADGRAALITVALTLGDVREPETTG